MFRLAIQGYLLMLIFFMHLTVLACDETCLIPVPFVRSLLPKVLLDLAVNFLNVFNMDALTAQVVGQFMVIGDIFIGILVIIKVFGAILKRFLVMLGSLILTIVALQRMGLI